MFRQRNALKQHIVSEQLGCNQLVQSINLDLLRSGTLPGCADQCIPRIQQGFLDSIYLKQIAVFSCTVTNFGPNTI